MTPPPGTVTFLFTDIEGSTRRWERAPAAMAAALARHDALVRAAVAPYHGEIYKTIGDAFQIAFASPVDAVLAANEAQRRLAAEDWSTLVAGDPTASGRSTPLASDPAANDDPTLAAAPLRVRMALHAGAATRAPDGDYRTPLLNRVDRLLSAGYGGQVLLTQVVEGLVEGRLPGGLALRDMGERRLKDLRQPERVFQLVDPSLPADFPPLATLDARPHNLPVRRSSFVGRERELAEVKARLGRTHLLTLKGVGGLGKTSLALQAAADLIDDFPHGVWFIDLAPLTEPDLVAQSAAAVLGLREEPGQPLADALIDHLRGRELLLILDNCEHLIETCAGLAQAVLERCPKVRLLATSRETLRVPSEAVWRVPPLALPEIGGRDPAVELLRSEAARLFVERAQQATPSFMLTAANAPAVAEICRRLDGIALAIELAAARVQLMPPEKIAERLGESLRLLAKGPRTALRHQATLRAAIDWSYDLCTEDEQRLLRRLSVFHGGWPLEAAQAICADDRLDEWDILDLLTLLADRSLVEVDLADADHPRHYLLETIRQYAADKLAESDEDVAALRGRHLAWYGTLAAEGDQGLKGADQADWLTRLETEHDNLRAALEWSADRGSTEDGLRLGGHVWRFWHRRGYIGEGRRRLDAMLACPDAGDDPAAHAAALHAAGTLAVLQGDLDTARGRLERCLEIRRGLGDLAGMSATLNNLAMVANQAGDNAAARRTLEENLDVVRQLGDDWATANVLYNLANADLVEGRFDRSRARLEESLQLWRVLGDRSMEASTLQSLAAIDQFTCDNSTAESRYRTSLEILETLGNSSNIAAIKRNLGRLMHAEGDLDSARTLFRQSLNLALSQDDRGAAAHALIESGRLERHTADLDAAEVAFRESAALLEGIDDPVTRSALDNATGRMLCERGDLGAARRHLEQALTRRYQMGRRPWIVSVLESLAILALAEGDNARAITLASAAETERRTLGMPLESFEARELGMAIDRAAAALTASEAESARTIGSAMSVDAAVDLAMTRARGGID